MSKKKAIGRAALADKYEFNHHALDEMDDDELTETDVRQALLHGKVVAELTDDPPWRSLRRSKNPKSSGRPDRGNL